MHETILKAWKGIAGLKQPKYFKTWLIRILINESIRIRRQKNPECFVNPKLDSEDDIITFPEVASERPEWQPGQILEFEDMMRMLSMPVREVLVLYYGVAHWNAYFNALIYLRDTTKHPLQVILRNILLANQNALSSAVSDMYSGWLNTL